MILGVNVLIGCDGVLGIRNGPILVNEVAGPRLSAILRVNLVAAFFFPAG